MKEVLYPLTLVQCRTAFKTETSTGHSTCKLHPQLLSTLVHQSTKLTLTNSLQAVIIPQQSTVHKY